jgi:hypothetical protein
MGRTAKILQVRRPAFTGLTMLSWNEAFPFLFPLSSFYGGIARGNPAQVRLPVYLFLKIPWKSTNKNIARNAISPLHVKWVILPIASAAW